MNAILNLSDGPMTMSSREIAELTGKNHADVMRDIRNMVEQLTKADLLSCAESTTYTGKDGRQYPQYELDKDTTLTLLLGYDPVARMKVVKRWQQLETQAAAPAVALPSKKELAFMLIESEDAREKAEAERDQLAIENHAKAEALAIVSPKAEALDRFATFAEGSMCITNAAKALQVQPKAFFRWLQEHQWIYRRTGGSGWLAYQARIQVGYLDHKVTTVERSDGTQKVVEQVLVTAKGLAKLSGQLNLQPA